jgi:phosphoribosylglycinamide formyltransferase-1
LLKLGWFSTGRDKAASNLLQTVNTAIKRGEIEAETSFVFSSRGGGESADPTGTLSLHITLPLPSERGALKGGELDQ